MSLSDEHRKKMVLTMGYLAGIQEQLSVMEDEIEGTPEGHDLMQAITHIEDAFLRIGNMLNPARDLVERAKEAVK